MINYLHALLHRPERGWDPISPAYVADYSDKVWREGPNTAVIDELERWLGGFHGKRVLDLGGGPGHYTVAFSERGASVTWHDVSRGYLEVAKKKAEEAGVQISFSLGYMEDAPRRFREPFDLVFNNICWYYSRDDRAFAQIVFDLVKPGGVGYVDTVISPVKSARSSLLKTYTAALNNRLGIKIGHPLPERGRVAGLFVNKAVDRMLVDYTSSSNDRILFAKSRKQASDR